MVQKVVRARIVFFDSNPIGRIFTRFSKDVSVMDQILPQVFVFATFGIFRTITVVMVVAYLYPYLIIVVLFALFLMYLLIDNVICSVRESLRMDSIYRGPIHTSFTNIVNGLVSLRSYERISYFR